MSNKIAGPDHYEEDGKELELLGAYEGEEGNDPDLNFL